MKKLFITILILFLMSGCSSVISTSSNNSKSYDYKLYFDDEDIDDTYDDENYVVLDGSCDFRIDEAGTYILSGTLNGSVIIDVSKNDEVKLVLDGVTINSDDFASIYIIEADKVTITLASDSENYLSDSGSEYTQIDDNNVDSVIFSKADLVFNGTGSLTIDANYKHGIVSKDDLIFINGTYNIDSVSQGINGKDSVRIKDGTFNIVTLKDSIKSTNDEDEGRGYVYIAGGVINIDSGDDAIQAYNDLIIDDGTINITNSYEGLEAAYITINGGNISITSTDDGINAANKAGSEATTFSGNSDSSLKITGGTLYINAEGDGVDSNGEVFISGGTITVEGPLSGGDAAFDYETGGYITGGEVIMIGQSSMAEGFTSDASTTVNLLYNLDSSYPAGTNIAIYKEDGTKVFDLTTTKQFNSLLIASEQLEVGETITMVIGEDTITYELTDITNAYGSTGMNGGMNFGGGGMTPPNNNGDNNFDPNDLPDDFDMGNTPSPPNSETSQE